MLAALIACGRASPVVTPAASPSPRVLAEPRDYNQYRRLSPPPSNANPKLAGEEAYRKCLASKFCFVRDDVGTPDLILGSFTAEDYGEVDSAGRETLRLNKRLVWAIQYHGVTTRAAGGQESAEQEVVVLIDANTGEVLLQFSF